MASTTSLSAQSADEVFAQGAALYASGRNAEAVVLLERAVALKPNSAEMHNDLGVALDAADRRIDALEHYR